MLEAVRQRVTVGPGGLIEIRSPQLQSGSSAEVIVLIDPPETGPLSPVDAFKALQDSMNLDSDAAERWVRQNDEERRVSSSRLEPPAR